MTSAAATAATMRNTAVTSTTAEYGQQIGYQLGHGGGRYDVHASDLEELSHNRRHQNTPFTKCHSMNMKPSTRNRSSIPSVTVYSSKGLERNKPGSVDSCGSVVALT